MLLACCRTQVRALTAAGLPTIHRRHHVKHLLVIASVLVMLASPSPALADTGEDQKAVLITGATTGIGRAAAERLAAAGVFVYAGARKDVDIEELNRIENIRAVRLDVTKQDQVDAAVAMIKEKGTGLYALVNNAGVYEFHPVATTAFEEWQQSWKKTIFTNLLGPAHLSFHVVRHMMKSGGGKIINITSRGAFRGEPNAPAYGASKAGLNAFSQSMVQVLAAHNFFVYAVAPEFVETYIAASVLSGSEGDAIRAQSPLNRVARPEEVAGVLLFLAGYSVQIISKCSSITRPTS